jgi:hypothetical protein
VFVQGRDELVLGSGVVATVLVAKRLEEPHSLVEHVDPSQKGVYYREDDLDQEMEVLANQGEAAWRLEAKTVAA